MLDSTGMGRIEYEDVMRALGYFIDQNSIREVCLIELREGMLLRGVRHAVNRSGYQTISESFLFTNEDLERLVQEAYERRNAAEADKQQQQQQQQQRGGLFRKT